MKKQIRMAGILMLFVLILTIPTFAFVDHGNVYTAMDGLDNQRLEEQGTVTLPLLENQYAFGLRVDIVEDLEGYTLEEYAQIFYDKYEYGYGDNKDGALLMIYATGDGYTVEIQDYIIYTGGFGTDLMLGSGGSKLYDMLDLLLLQYTSLSYDEAGEICANAVDVFFGNMTTMLIEGVSAPVAPIEEPEVPAEPTEEPVEEPVEEPAETPDEPPVEEPAETPEEAPAEESAETPAEAPAEEDTQPASPVAETTNAPAASEAEKAEGSQLILDQAELLDDTQLLRLESKAQKISQRHGCNLYVLAVPTMNGAQRREFAKTYYNEHNLGNGEFRNGVLFLIAMDTRDYVTITYGRNPQNTSEYGPGVLAFTDYGVEKLEEQVVPYLSDGDYYKAFDCYLDTCSTYLDLYAQGEAFDKGTRLPGESIFGPIQIAIIILLPLLIAFIVCMIFKAQMKTAKQAVMAGDYMDKDSFELTESRDIFLKRDRTRRKIEKSSSSGGSSTDSDGFGGSSGGKF